MTLSAAEHRRLAAEWHDIERRLATISAPLSGLKIRAVSGAARGARHALRQLRGELSKACGAGLYGDVQDEEKGA
jgi:hypothetical protein